MLPRGGAPGARGAGRLPDEISAATRARVGFRDLKYFNYWGRIPRELQRNGAAVYYGHQQAWGTIEDNAEAIRAKILEIQTETGCEKVNIIAHSKGGLDARYLITRLGMGETVASLTTISTPHRGSELLDLLGKLPDGLYRKICGMVDAAFRKVGDRAPDACTASRQLAPAFAEAFNAETPDDPRVSYRSWATVMKNPLSDPLLSIPYFLLRCVRGPNDGSCVSTRPSGDVRRRAPPAGGAAAFRTATSSTSSGRTTGASTSSNGMSGLCPACATTGSNPGGGPGSPGNSE